LGQYAVYGVVSLKLEWNMALSFAWPTQSVNLSYCP